MLEFRTFESFPGLRRALQDLLRTLGSTPNRFVLASRYVARASRVLAANPPFVVSAMESVEEVELSRMLAGAALPRGHDPAEGNGDSPTGLAPLVGRLCDGRPTFVRALAQTMAEVPGTGSDPVAALAAGFEPDGRVAAICCHTYELRLHRARGYGALKAILDILADEEPLTLTEVSQRLGRTPGSTKDYLSWLEDVDLVTLGAEALPLPRPAAAGVGEAALPAQPARAGGNRAGSAAVRGANGTGHRVVAGCETLAT